MSVRRLLVLFALFMIGPFGTVAAVQSVTGESPVDVCEHLTDTNRAGRNAIGRPGGDVERIDARRHDLGPLPQMWCRFTFDDGEVQVHRWPTTWAWLGSAGSCVAFAVVGAVTVARNAFA